MRARLALLLAAGVLAGCGGEPVGSGTASLWVTRDRGAHVLLVRTVPAGLTAMRALQRVARVKTRYGGRYVQAINGLQGSLTQRRDWFYFVNGIEADRGATEYRLHPGDVEWWDYRSWRTRMTQPVVVGAFPEPFLHGYDGKRRPAVVRYSSPRLAAGARAIGRVTGARSVAPSTVPVPKDANLFLLVTGPPRFYAELRSGAVRFVFAGDAMRLARDPRWVRFRYEGLPAPLAGSATAGRSPALPSLTPLPAGCRARGACPYYLYCPARRALASFASGAPGARGSP